MYQVQVIPDSEVYGINKGPTWGRQDPGRPHVGPMNFAIWDIIPLQRSLIASWWFTYIYNFIFWSSTDSSQCSIHPMELWDKQRHKDLSTVRSKINVSCRLFGLKKLKREDTHPCLFWALELVVTSPTVAPDGLIYFIYPGVIIQTSLSKVVCVLPNGQHVLWFMWYIKWYFVRNTNIIIQNGSHIFCVGKFR